jgi:chromosome segregation ATPase
MKNLLCILSVVALLGAPAQAGHRNGSSKACCSPCQTRWYKAKDGTYREMLPYAKALSRAEDADDMEPVLKQAQADLVTANEQIEAIRSEAAKAKAELESQLAVLRNQMEAEQQNVVSQKERADKAEAAHKACIEQVAQLREEAKKKDEALASAKSELNTVTEDRNRLKTANTDLEKQVSDLNAARTAAEEALKKAQEELAKAKQEATESKKAKVEDETKPDDSDAGKNSDN